jgi:hypothetical protein
MPPSPRRAITVDLAGARAQTICDACLPPNAVRGGAWSPSGVILFAGNSCDVDRSGRFLIWTSEDANSIGDRTMLTVIQNWTRLLGRERGK